MDEVDVRQRRWRMFQGIFALAYVGILGDIATTALGYLKAGSAYEQNPLGGGLIGTLGWPGMVIVLSALCAICYYSVRVVYARMSPRWGIVINGLMILITLVRWLAVVTYVIYLLQPISHP
ncbi:MAG: hypothetical protein NVSMB52_01920 [Chloroflexota bacterium]